MRKPSLEVDDVPNSHLGSRSARPKATLGTRQRLRQLDPQLPHPLQSVRAPAMRPPPVLSLLRRSRRSIRRLRRLKSRGRRCASTLAVLPTILTRYKVTNLGLIPMWLKAQRPEVFVSIILCYSSFSDAHDCRAKLKSASRKAPTSSHLQFPQANPRLSSRRLRLPLHRRRRHYRRPLSLLWPGLCRWNRATRMDPPVRRQSIH